MEFDQVKELIKLIDSSNLAFFEISNGDNHIKMDKSLNRACNENSSNNSGNISSEITNIKSTEKAEDIKVKEKQTDKKIQDIEDDNGLITITSPMVGTFYSKASPESGSFVKEGDVIAKGKVICIIEAMKLMNEIESDYSGSVVKCLVNDGDMVEYGQPLFKMREE